MLDTMRVCHECVINLIVEVLAVYLLQHEIIAFPLILLDSE